MDAIRWVQDLPFSTWIRESSWAVFTFLILHMWGLALLVGGSALVALRNFGFAKTIEPALFKRFTPVMWTGFVLALISGLLLLMAYPAKHLTNPVFAVKFAFLIAGALLTRRLLNGSGSLRLTAAAVLLAWAGVIACGDLLKYTNTVLLVY